MKNKKLLVVFSLTVFIIATSSMFSQNGRSGKTGSPSEGTCVDCHTGTLNSGPGSLTITSDIPNWVYAPGQTYHVSVTVAQASIALFGIDVEALKGDNTNAGSLIITNSTETQLKTVSATGRINVVHQTNGGLASPAGSKTFTFDWKAPSADSGVVTFYVAGLATNNNGSTSGDYTYAKTQVVNSPLTSGVNDLSATISFSVYPSPAREVFHLEAYMPAFGPVHAELYSLNGQKAADLFTETVAHGLLQKTVAVPFVSPGIYLLKISQNEKTAIQRIVFQ